MLSGSCGMRISESTLSGSREQIASLPYARRDYSNMSIDPGQMFHYTIKKYLVDKEEFLEILVEKDMRWKF